MGMIGEALFLGGMSALAGILVYKKSGPRVKKFVVDHPLMSEAGSTILAFLVMGGGVTAIMGASVCCVCISGALYVAKNKEDFEWLDDALKRCNGHLGELKEFIKEKNAEYLASKEA